MNLNPYIFVITADIDEKRLVSFERSINRVSFMLVYSSLNTNFLLFFFSFCLSLFLFLFLLRYLFLNH